MYSEYSDYYPQPFPSQVDSTPEYWAKQSFDLPVFYPSPCLYAPIPVPAQGFTALNYEYSALQPEPAPPIYPEPPMPTFTPMESFPTPSEMLSNHSYTIRSTKMRKPSTARKTRRQSLMKNLGFTPTDSDTISSHEKKRFYIECLEQYVTYLNEQLALVNKSPGPIKRIAPPHNGLDKHSIRTILIHMQNTTKALAQRVATEERRYLYLQNAYDQQALRTDSQ